MGFFSRIKQTAGNVIGKAKQMGGDIIHVAKDIGADAIRSVPYVGEAAMDLINGKSVKNTVIEAGKNLPFIGSMIETGQAIKNGVKQMPGNIKTGAKNRMLPKIVTL